MIVIIESPYAGAVSHNLAYVREAMRHALMRGESPYASHALYTQPGVLDDDDESERSLGIQAGFAFRQAADLTAFYIDLGVSRGMVWGARHAREIGCAVELRSIRSATFDQWQDARVSLGLPMVGEP